RDFHVTGVQTCALPICPIAARTARITAHQPGLRPDVAVRGYLATGSRGSPRRPKTPAEHGPKVATGGSLEKVFGGYCTNATCSRSEERRVGKECRWGRW